MTNLMSQRNFKSRLSQGWKIRSGVGMEIIVFPDLASNMSYNASKIGIIKASALNYSIAPVIFVEPSDIENFEMLNLESALNLVTK